MKKNLDYALKYAAIGWHVFPIWGGDGSGNCKCGNNSLCKSPGKHPVSHLVPSGQNDATTDPQTIKRWWTTMPDAGIAIFLAPSGLMAIDIDPRNGGIETMEAIEATHGPLVSEVLAFTQGGGEHRVFAHRNGGTLPGKLGPGVDIKLNGYICVEPTQGIVGSYAWEASSDPLDGAIPSPLPDWIRDLAGRVPDGANTSITDRLSHPIGSRYANPAQITELREALTFLGSDDRDTWIKYGMALHPLGQAGFDLWDEWSQTSKKYDPVDQIRTWRSFRPSAINFESIFYAAQLQGWINPLSQSAPDLPSPVCPPASPTITNLPPPTNTQIPDFRLPGVLGVVQDWIDATSRKPQPAFSVQAALAFASTVLGRRFVTCQQNWPALFYMNIGKSASGKEHAKWAIEKLLDACKLPHLIGPAGYTSDSGVLSSLHHQPSHIAIMDEFGKVLERASIKHGARSASTLSMLMEVWARADGVVRLQGYSTVGMSAQDIQKMGDRAAVRIPSLTLLTMTTPESFFDSVGSAATRDGFLNRFLIVESDIGRQPSRAVTPIPIPDEIIAWVQASRSQEGIANDSPSMIPNATVVPFSRDALTLRAQFEAESMARMDDHDHSGLAEMFGRHTEIAMRLALLICVGRGGAMIEVQDLEWATRYVYYHGMRTVTRLQECVADSEFQACKLQALALIKKSGERGLTERELGKMSRKFAALDQRGQINVLNSLVFSGDILRVEIPTVLGRGKKRLAWIAVQVHDATIDE